MDLQADVCAGTFALMLFGPNPCTSKGCIWDAVCIASGKEGLCAGLWLNPKKVRRSPPLPLPPMRAHE